MATNVFNPLSQDLSIFKRFDFAKPPVGVKFLYREPIGKNRIETPMAICEMIREAQNASEPFYMTAEDEDCFGSVALGMDSMPPFAEAGMIGEGLGIFTEARANARLYNYLPKAAPGTINYVLFSPLECLDFEPDLLIIMSTVSQAEILMRAMDHFSGEPRESRTTGVLGCAWLLTYPYQTGKINYTITGLSYGTKAKKVFPEGLILFSIPYDWIPLLIHSLSKITWDMPAYKMSVKEFKEFEGRVVNGLVQEMESR